MTVFTPNDDAEQGRATTDTDRDDPAEENPTQTMGGVSHTNPETGESFGDSQVYTRGRVAIVDGGTAESEAEREPEEAESEAATREDGEEPMGEIDHTPREGAPDASEVYERGGEGKENRSEDADVAEDDDV